MSDVVEVAAAVLIDGDRVLACQRPFDGSHPGKWEFPGGKRKANESRTACLARELREELGIDATVGAEIWRTRHLYRPQQPLDLFFFTIRSYQGEIVNHAFAGLRWVRRGELSSLDFLDADRPLVRWLDRRDARG
jgi:8-oxo-dGTP diphosphatase